MINHRGISIAKNEEVRVFRRTDVQRADINCNAKTLWICIWLADDNAGRESVGEETVAESVDEHVALLWLAKNE